LGFSKVPLYMSLCIFEMRNAYYVYLLDAPFCNVLGMISHRYCGLV
jgi:hypothetical protein